MNPIHLSVFKIYCPETIFHMEIKGHNSDDNNWWILPLIVLDLHFMIIYLCIKNESNTSMYSKDIAQKPVWDGTYICTHLQTRVMLYAPPLEKVGA